MDNKLPPASGDVCEALEKYADMIYRIAFSYTKSSYDADDILQEVFLRYIKSSGVWQSEEHRKAWLIRVAVNCSKSLLTSAWYRKTVPLEDSLVTELQTNSEVYHAVMVLPSKYRIAIHLFYYEGLSVAEIAKAMQTKESTVKSYLHRAREKLKVSLKEEC